MCGLLKTPPVSGHNPLKILKSELLPQPLGPVMTVFIPLLTSKLIYLTKTSPFGETRGTFSNLMKSSVYTNLPLFI